MYYLVTTHNNMENRAIAILINAGYTLEQIRDILTENDKHYSEELAINHREYDGATPEKIMELDNERRDLTNKQVATKKALQEIYEITKDKETQKAAKAQQTQGQQAQNTDQPNPAQTADNSKQKVYEEINQLIYTLLNIKEDEKIQFRYICDVCFSIKASNTSIDYLKLSAKIDEKNQAIEKLCAEEIGKVNPRLKELFDMLTPEEKTKFASPSSLVKSTNPVTVKEQYRTIATEIFELEMAIHDNPENTTLINDYNQMINSLVKSISLLGTTLDDPKQFKEIQKEVDKELAEKRKAELEKRAAANQAPKQTEDSQKEQGNSTEGSERQNGGETTSETTSTTDHNEEEIKTAKVTHIGSDDENETKEEKTEKQVEVEEKQEYLDLIKENNSIVVQINNIIAEQEAIYASGNLTAESMKNIIEKDKRIGELSDRIHNIGLQLSDLEYKTMMEKRYFLPDDPSIKATPVATVKYDKPIAEFMEIHNKNIVEAYDKLKKISDRISSITDPAKKQEFKEKSKETSKILMDYVNAEKNMITRRLLAEKKADIDFDIVAFMEANRVDNKQQEQEQEQQKEETVVPTKSVEELTAEAESKLRELNGLLAKAKIAMLAAEFEAISLEEQQEKITKLNSQRTTLESEIEQIITSQEYSSVDFTSIKEKIKAEIDIELAKNVQEIKANETEKKQFQKYYREILESSKALQALSPEGKEQDGYQEKYIQLLGRLKEMKEELTGFDFKITSEKGVNVSYSYDYNGTKKIVSSETINLHQITKTETQKVEQEDKRKVVSAKLSETSLNIGSEIAQTDKGKAIIGELPKTKLVLYKTQLKIIYTKQLKELLQESQKQIGIAIQAKENTNSVTVGGTKETKDGKLVQTIVNPTEIDEAYISIMDENGNVITQADIMANPEIQEEIIARRSM